MEFNNPSQIVKDLHFGSDARNKVISGVTKLTSAVKSTLGASGHCVVYEDAMGRPVHQIIVTRPLQISEVATSYDVKCSVKGGGLSGQAGAIILGISKALIAHDENLKANLKKDKLTTRDSRVVERKKYGHRKARRSFQFSKR